MAECQGGRYESDGEKFTTRTVRKHFQSVPCQVDFNGNIHVETCSKLVVEILKYIIYTRGQIPQQYDLWCRHITTKKTTDEIKCGRRNPTASERNDCRKAERTANDIGEWIHHIEELFKKAEGTQIEEFLFVLGATSVSPKNVFSVKLPEKLFSTTNGDDFVPYRRCLLNVFKQLLKAEEMSAMTQLEATKMFLFVKMKCADKVEWFLPKPTFQPMLRGHWIYVTFVEYQQEQQFKIFNDLLSEAEPSNDSDEISKLPCDDTNVSHFTSRITIEELPGYSFSEIASNDFIWYQSPVVIKGFQSKLAEAPGIWM